MMTLLKRSRIDSKIKNLQTIPLEGYDSLLSELNELLESARRKAAQSVNTIMTMTYWFMGKRIVESEQKGLKRAGYGYALLKKLSIDLTAKFGRGFSERNLEQMRLFYLGWPISQTVSAKSPQIFIERCPLPWSHYVKLMVIENPHARAFYETEALRGGWSVRQLERQIDSQFYERTALSRNKVKMLKKGEKALPADKMTADEEIADAGQMHLYLNYAREHWTNKDENPPVGLILCAQKDEAIAHYTLEGLSNKVLAAEYKTTLPEEKLLSEEIQRSRRLLEHRSTEKSKSSQIQKGVTKKP